MENGVQWGLKYTEKGSEGVWNILVTHMLSISPYGKFYDWNEMSIKNEL